MSDSGNSYSTYERLCTERDRFQRERREVEEEKHRLAIAKYKRRRSPKRAPELDAQFEEAVKRRAEIDERLESVTRAIRDFPRDAEFLVQLKAAA